MSRKLDAEYFQPRLIQADVKKDVEFFGFFPMMAVAVGLPVFIASLLCAGMMYYLFGMGLMGFILLSLLPALIVIIYFKVDVPWRVKRYVKFKFYKDKKLTLDELHDVKGIDGAFITYTDNSKALLLEYETGTAWESSTFDLKSERVKAFSIMLPIILKSDVEVTVFATISKEDSRMFIVRRKLLKRCKTPEIRKMTEERLEYHAEIENKETTKTRYVIRLRTMSHSNDPEKAIEILKKSLKAARAFLEKDGAGINLFGKDLIEDYLEKQLVPASPTIRGKIVIQTKKHRLNFDIKSMFKVLKKLLWPTDE